MMTKSFGRVFLVFAALGLLPIDAFADEIIHFTNGSEMTVRSHSVENDKKMVKLDLGGNSFIAFPLSMVDKIVSAGQDVFLNPVFHPSNQAIAGGSGGAVADTSIRGTGDPAGFVRRPNAKGIAGLMHGEAADALPVGSMGGPEIDHTVANSRRIFSPGFQSAPGAAPQVIMPPGKARAPVQFAMVPSHPAEQLAPPSPSVNSGTPDNPLQGDPAPENPPDTP